MKIKILKTGLWILLMVLAQEGWSRGQVEKKRVIEKSYTVTASTALKINNKFGRIEISSWDKNEFGVKIEIVGKGRDEQRAQRIVDEIDVAINEGSSEISFETKISDSKTKNREGFEINYFISMPDANPLRIKNSFGDVSMGDRGGNLDLHVSYGSMKTGDVKGWTDLTLSFGSGSMNNIGDGELEVKYSSLEVESAKKLELIQGFSDIELEMVDELELESKYGGVELGKVNAVDADVQFSGFEIDELTGKLELKSNYVGDFRIGRLAKTFTLVDIRGKFSSYNIGLEPGLSATIDAEFSFADLKVDSDVDASFHYRVKESNKSMYKGKIGSGDESKVIRVDSSYGNLKLRED